MRERERETESARARQRQERKLKRESVMREREREKTVIFLWTGQVLVTPSPSLNMKREEETVEILTTQEASVRACVCTGHAADSGDKLQTAIILHRRTNAFTNTSADTKRGKK